MLRDLFEKYVFRYRVLIVEDDAMLSRVLAESLKGEKDITIRIVEDGSKVLSEVKDFSPSIILLDLVLPGLDGFSILKQLKEKKETQDIPVVVLSNLSSESDIKAIRALGAEEYFLKSNTDMSVIIDYVKKRLKK